MILDRNWDDNILVSDIFFMRLVFIQRDEFLASIIVYFSLLLIKNRPTCNLTALERYTVVHISSIT